MRNFLTFLLGISCVVVLFLGHSHWNKQIQASATNTIHLTIQQQESKSETVSQNNDNENDIASLLAYAKNWPQSSINRFQQTLNEKSTFKILFVGSPSIGSESSGTYKLVKENLLNTYNKKNLNVDLKTFDGTSTQLLESNLVQGIITEKADLIVLEPFLLLDNGKVKIEDSLKNITKLIAEVKAANPDTTFILQPSNPIYNAKFYLTQVAELKNYAPKNQIAYLDHWTVWPDTKSAEIKDYLLPNQNVPSEKGSQVWSDFLIKYFINK